MNGSSLHRNLRRLPARQRGVVMIIATIGMVALLAMAGLALDSGHMFLTKTRLQNAIDASALSAAKVLSTTGNMTLASGEAQTVFGENASAPGNGELQAAWSSGEITLAVEFSETISPFSPTSTGSPPYVRVTATGMALESWLIQVVGVNEKAVNASAIAGPSASLTGLTDILPIVACGCRSGEAGCCDPNDTVNCSADQYLEASYPTPDAGDPLTLDKIVALSLPAGTESDVGSGNFQFLRLEGASGANDLRYALAGNVTGLSADVDQNGDEWVDTEPGNSVGPVEDGMNSRFDGSNRLDVKADYFQTEFLGDVGDGTDQLVIVEDAEGNPSVATESGTVPAEDDPVYDYSAYKSDYDNASDPPASCTSSGGVGCERWRRMMILPVAQCDGSANGANTLQVRAYACFFLLQRVSHTGDQPIFGQFVPNPGGTSVPGCEANGGLSNNNSNYAPTRIVLYRNAASGDS